VGIYFEELGEFFNWCKSQPQSPLNINETQQFEIDSSLQDTSDPEDTVEEYVEAGYNCDPEILHDAVSYSLNFMSSFDKNRSVFMVTIPYSGSTNFEAKFGCNFKVRSYAIPEFPGGCNSG